MRTYMVGGAVRDMLLGRPVQDRDWVVVGATPEAMLAAGFKPVGKDFPVFLHPRSGEEYALARTERKHGRGHGGFCFYTAPDVSLEQDLQRRDLTINAIARAEDGTLIDPCGGVHDISRRVLRHIGPAFAEDPLRVLRVARFAARFADFEVAGDTLDLMRDMVASGELDTLNAERRWQELSRGLMEAAPSRMFQVLRDCHALDAVLPELAAPLADPARASPIIGLLDRCAAHAEPLPIRWACLLTLTLARAGDSPAQVGARACSVSQRLKTPNDCRDLARRHSHERGALLAAPQEGAEAVVALLTRCDALRRPERFGQLLACLDYTDPQPGLRERWQRLLQAASNIDGGQIAQTLADPASIAIAIRAARCAAVAAELHALAIPQPTPSNQP